MRVRVLFFGMLKDLMGRSSDELSLPAGSTVADLLARYEQAVPRLHDYSRAIALSVNQQYAAPTAALHDNDEVGMLPPVSGGKDGGAGAPGRFEPVVQIVHSRIVPHDIVPPLERPEDGAIVIFDGIVRNHSRGRRTLYLDYEAYEE